MRTTPFYSTPNTTSRRMIDVNTLEICLTFMFTTRPERTNQDPTRRPCTVHAQGLLSIVSSASAASEAWLCAGKWPGPPSSIFYSIISLPTSGPTDDQCNLCLSWGFTHSRSEKFNMNSILKLTLDCRCPSSRIRLGREGHIFVAFDQIS